MRSGKKLEGLILTAGTCLLLCGCAGTVEEIRPPAPAAPQEVAVLAAFQKEDGQALTRGVARLLEDGQEEDYPLDWGGQACFLNVPREGAVGVSLLDGEEQVLGSTTVTFSLGAVIDASTDQEGAGYVTLREDTSQVELVFVLGSGGTLQCALRLEP